MSGEIDDSVSLLELVMNKRSERINEAKEEVLKFGTDKGEVCILGSCVSANVDVSDLIKRVNWLCRRVKPWLKCSRLITR